MRVRILNKYGALNPPQGSVIADAEKAIADAASHLFQNGHKYLVGGFNAAEIRVLSEQLQSTIAGCAATHILKQASRTKEVHEDENVPPRTIPSKPQPGILGVEDMTEQEFKERNDAPWET